MNNRIKFRKATSPAFNKGEVWIGTSGVQCWIVSVEKYKGCTGEHSSDYEVMYSYSDGTLSWKDAWNFQVRYTHHSDIQATIHAY